ncbi:Syntaxin-like protein, partial [Globisporangium splendens]
MKSRAMEKALLQEALECDKLETGDEIEKPEWVYFVDEANEAIRLLHVKLEYLRLIHARRLMIRFDDAEEEQEQEINQITAEITSLFQTADRNLKKITSPFIGGVPCTSATDRLVRVNTQRSIASRLQGISYQFRRRQHEYLQRLQVQKFGCEIFDVDNLESPERDEASQKFDIDYEMTRFKIKSRDKEIEQIAKSVALLATVFKEVADMVIDQGTLIDRIDYNMEQVVCRVRSELKELHRAERYQRNTRSERCILILVTLIFTCFLILLAKHS